MAKPNFTLPNKPAIKSGSILSYNYTDDFTFVPAPLTFNRDSAATRVNEKGLIEDVGYFGPELVQNGDFEQIGSELITNGNFDSNSDWLVFGNTEISNGKANLNSGNGSYAATLRQDSVVTNLKNYKISFTISNYQEGEAIISIGYNTSITVDANGDYTFYGVSQSGDNTNFLVRNGASNFVGSIDNVSVKEVGQNWDFGTGWSMGDGKAVFTSGTSGILFQSNIVETGKLYKLTFDIIRTSGFINSVFLGGVSNNTDISESGSYTYYITSINQDVLGFNADSTFNGSITNISVIEVLGDKPRIDYSDSLTEPSLLLEPQSTNLITHSEDFSNVAWEYGGDVAIESGYTAPDGSNTAYKVTGTNSNLAINASATSTQTRSIYAKTLSGTGTVQLLSHNSNTNNVFTITPQWQRFEVNSLTSTTGSFYFYAVDFRGASTTLSEVILWGAQLEDLSYATSYIPTAGSTATRLGETATNAGDVNVFNSEKGVLYFEVKTDNTDVGSISINDGTSSVRITARVRPDINKIQMAIIGSTDDFNYNSAPITLSEYNKIAIVYNNSQYYFFVNGVKSTVQNKGTFSANSFIQFDFNKGGGSEIFYGKVRNIKAFNKALTDRELEILTIQ